MDDYGLGRLLGYIQDKSYIGSGDAPYGGSPSRQKNPIPEKGYEPIQSFVPGLASIAGAWATGSDSDMFYDMMGLKPVDGSPNLASIPTNTLNLTGTNIQNQVNQGVVDQVKNIIEEAGGRVVEGTADLGNLIIQAVTLGQGPKLEAVIPNIFDLVTGNVGGTLVFGGGQNPVPVVGTGQTGVGAGTKVGVNVPVLGPIIQGAINVYKQGGTLADVIASIPGTLANNPAEVLAGAAAAGLLFDEKDKDTLVSLGVDPTIIKTQDSNVGGAGTEVVSTDTPTKRQPDVDVGGDTKNVNVDPEGLGRTNTDVVTKVLKDAPSTYVADTPTKILKDAPNTYVKDITPIKTGLEQDLDVAEIIRTNAGTDVSAPVAPAVTTEVKTSTPPAGAAAGVAGVGNLPAGGGGVVEIAGEPGELVDIDYLFDVGGDSIFAPEILEEDEDELLYPYSGGGAVKRFRTGDQVTDDYLASVGGSSYGTDSGMQSRSNVDATQEKNIFQKGLPALIGAGLGAAFGLIDKDKPNPSGYQGGIPEYKYNRSLVPDAFSTTNADGTPRRPGSAGRSYFTQGTYDPIMETVDGVQVQSTLGGAQRRADEAAMAAQATEEEDYIAQIGQDFLDLQPVDTTEGLEFTGTITEDFINKYPNAGTGVVDTGAGAGAGVAGTTGVVATEFDTFMAPFLNRPDGLTKEDYLALGNSPYTAQQILNKLNTANTGADAISLQTLLDNVAIASGTYVAPASTGNTDTTVNSFSAYDALLNQYDPTTQPSDENVNTVIEAIRGSDDATPKPIGNVAADFGVSESDIYSNLLRRGAYTPAELATRLAADTNTDYTEEDLILRLLEDGQTSAEEVLAYYQNTDPEQFGNTTVEDVKEYFRKAGGTRTLAHGGMLQGDGYYLGGTTDGMADEVPATIGGNQPAALSDGEFVVPADVVSHLGNGNSDAGAKQLYSMMDRVRKKRTGTTEQGTEINPMQQLPA